MGNRTSLSCKLGQSIKLNDLIDALDLKDFPSGHVILGTEDKVQKKIALRKVVARYFELIVLDIIENNVTFELPLFFNKKGRIKTRVIEGDRFDRLFKYGVFDGLDPMKSQFKMYELVMQIEYKNGRTRDIPISLDKELTSMLIGKVNNGMIYY